MYNLIKSILFLLSAEKAHHFTMRSLGILNKIPVLRSLVFSKRSVKSTTRLMGLEFPNKFGMAAGFDKNAEYLEVLKNLGFGFVEIGTVTPKAQDGNPKPRLFRLPKDEALINRMGFNNHGVDAAKRRLQAYRKKFGNDLIIGGNIGKNKVTPNESAEEDYAICFRALHAYVDYFVINVSSPNTPNLRELQEKEPLKKLFNRLKIEEELLVQEGLTKKPVLLKIAPDLGDELLDDIIDLVVESGLEGLIATNTTIDRSNLKTPQPEIESIGAGGLSGQPLTDRSTEVIRRIRHRNKDLVIIGVGGIQSKSDAKQKLEAGADLIQIYTGFIYGGPNLLAELKEL